MDICDLIPGGLYFHVRFCDANRTVPKIDTLIFVGMNTNVETKETLSEDFGLFSDPGIEYQSDFSELLERHGYKGEKLLSSEIFVPVSSMHDVYDLNGLIALLKNLAPA